MPTTATLAPPVIFSHSGAWPSYFANQNKTAHNFPPFSLNFHCLTRASPASTRKICLNSQKLTRVGMYAIQGLWTADQLQPDGSTLSVSHLPNHSGKVSASPAFCHSPAGRRLLVGQDRSRALPHNYWALLHN
jgi:hypothetical protein